MSDGSIATWVSRHGLLKLALGHAARRGEPQAQLMVDREVRKDPYPVYERIRKHGPVYRGRVAYAAVSHEAASAVLRSDVFSVGLDLATVPWFMRRTLVRDADRMVFDPIEPPSLLAVNPPDHTRYRRLVSKVFTARAIAALEERVEKIAAELLDDLTGRGAVDLASTYASLLPVTVIAEILGVPVGMRGEFLRWGELAAPSLDIGLSLREYREVERGLNGVSGWLAGHIRNLRKAPGDDLLSRLVHTVDDDGNRLSDKELLATAALILAAGFETTTNLLTTGTYLLLRNPEQLARLRADPGRWANAVDEVLRIEAPVQNTARFAREETEICGVRIPERAFVAVLVGGANRDPDVFPDPAAFDVTRINARDHLAFSAGLHHCLGAALARSEGRIGLQLLFERFPNLALAGRPKPRPTRTLRGYRTMPVLPGAVGAKP